MKIILKERLKKKLFARNRHNTLAIQFFLFVVLFFSVGSSYGQDTLLVQDLETWSSVNLKYKINKKWAVALAGQLRLKNNSSEINQYFGQFDVEYSLSKHIDFSGAIRYITKNDNTGNIQGKENYFRYQFDGTYKHKLKDLNLKYRVRYQNRKELEVSEDPKQSVRFKAGMEYNIKKWKLDPELSGELFRSINSETENKLESYRITLGTTFKVHKSAKMKLFYRYDKELNTDYPLAVNIIGIKYTYSLK